MTLKTAKKNLQEASDLVDDIYENYGVDIDQEPELKAVLKKLDEAKSYF